MFIFENGLIICTLISVIRAQNKLLVGYKFQSFVNIKYYCDKTKVKLQFFYANYTNRDIKAY